MRERAVMISSTMPSAKYSCSGSPLRLRNGSTASGLVRNRGALFGSRVVGRGRVSRAQEPIAAPGDGHNPAFAVTVLLERFAQRRDVHLDVVFLDDYPGPHPLHQLVFADDSALGRGQYTENVERPAAEPHRCLIAPQLAPGEIKPEPAEADLALDHRNVSLENN